MPRTLVQISVMNGDAVPFHSLFKILGVAPPVGGAITLFVSMDRQSPSDPRTIRFLSNGDEEPEGFFHVWSGLDSMRKPIHVWVEGKPNG